MYMSTGKRAKRRTRITRANSKFKDFWNLDGFSDHKSWRSHWKTLVTPVLNKDFRVIAKKEQRYDDLWTAHVALMDGKCPGCKKTKAYRDKIKAVEKDLRASQKEVKRLDAIIKDFAIKSKKKEKAS